MSEGDAGESRGQAGVAVDHPDLVGFGIEPPCDAADLVDQVGSERHVRLGAAGGASGMSNPSRVGSASSGRSTATSTPLWTSARKVAGTLDHDRAGVAQPLDVSLPPQGAGERLGPIAHVGRFLEPLGVRERHHLLSQRLEQQRRARS